MLAKIKSRRAQSSLLNRFANVNEFVQFGSITNDDHIERIRGATFSPSSKDNNFMHSNVNGHEVTFFTRESSHTSRQHGTGDYDWSVLSIELGAHGLPHVIFDNKKHDKRFYNSVFTRYPKLRVANQALSLVNVSAAQNFDLYMAPQNILSLTSMFSDEILQRMTLYYGKFDIEIEGNRLYVFTRGNPGSYMQLKEMLEEALWLSERLNMRGTYEATENQSNEELSFVTA